MREAFENKGTVWQFKIIEPLPPSSLPSPLSEDAAGEAVLPTTEAGPLEARRSSRSSQRPAAATELDGVAAELVGVVGAWSRRGGGGCSGVGVVSPDGRGGAWRPGPIWAWMGLGGLRLWCAMAARETTSPVLRPWW
jgi:hypothetical protein